MCSPNKERILYYPLHLSVAMQHTTFPSQMMAQMMTGQQTNGQCPPAQAHTLHFNGTINANTLYQTNCTQYNSNSSGHGRRTMQVYVKLSLLDLFWTICSNVIYSFKYTLYFVKLVYIYNNKYIVNSDKCSKHIK